MVPLLVVSCILSVTVDMVTVRYCPFYLFMSAVCLMSRYIVEFQSKQLLEIVDGTMQALFNGLHKLYNLIPLFFDGGELTLPSS